MQESSVRPSERILVFDPVPLFESVLTDELNALGFRVDTASVASHAARLADTRPYDLVLVAEAVSRDDAVGLCDHLKSRGTDAPPILVLTSLGAVESETDRAALRADDFLVIPYTATEVLIRVQTMLRARAERDALLASVSKLNATHLEAQQLGQDGLTELPNRRYLEDFATRELIRAERYERVISLVKVELDNLQSVNAAHGRDAEHEVLRQVAGLFRQSVRCVDFTARYDEDEFAIVLPETDKPGAALAAERVRDRIARLQLSSPAGVPIPNVTASLGVATFPHDAKDLPHLIGVADRHLCRAREQGRNRVAIGV